MALERMITRMLIVGIALVAISYRAQGGRGLTAGISTTVFDVTQYRGLPADPDEGEDPDAEPSICKGDGVTLCTMALMKTWDKACESPVAATVRVPKGKFLIKEALFHGPCKAPVTFDLQGTLLATTDMSDYVNGPWITFQKMNHFLLTGPGTFNGQGEKSYHYDNCKGKAVCQSLLPPSIVFSQVNNSVMQNVHLLNSKGFHMKINDLSDFTVHNINIKAPWNSPNTDGIHISGSNRVVIKDSVIETGDDCISIGEGSTNVNVSGIFCGPGHGISVGSLGYREMDRDVIGISVKNCTLTNTTNGARIKTWHESPPLKATNIRFEDLVFKMVKNPIYIDQHYGSKGKKGASNVKISDVHFKNIRGTTISNNVVSFLCSPKVPCEKLEVADINLSIVGKKNLTLASVCDNARATFLGKITPTRCAKSS